MSRSRPFTLIAAALFAVMAAGHAYRIVMPFRVRVGDFFLPEWASWFGLAFAGLLSVMLFRERRRRHRVRR